MGPIETPTLSANRFVRDFSADSTLSCRQSHFVPQSIGRPLLYCSARDGKPDATERERAIERIARAEVRYSSWIGSVDDRRR